MPSTRGPISKRSDQRRRRNAKPGLERVQAGSTSVRIPAASKEWHPIARGWYMSLKRSGQSRYYQASDWYTAKYYAELMSASLFTDEPNASLVAAIINGSRDLMTTEGQRRRMNLELTTGPAPAGASEADEAESRIDNVINLASAGA